MSAQAGNEAAGTRGIALQWRQAKGRHTKRYLTDCTHTFKTGTLRLHTAVGNPEMQLVKVYPNVGFQTIVGFGAALTEASGYVFSRMGENARNRFVELCFGPGGNRYSLCRLSVQSCDFSLTTRPYMAKRDATLASFSVDDDWGYVLPLVKAAQAVNPELQFLASPWSPPAWAKTNRSMKRGGRLKRDSYDIWARMIAQTLLAYREAGVNIDRLTVQNEPQARQIWESCLYNAKQERTFLHTHLKPALNDAGLSQVKTFIWDHNKESMLERAAAILGDEQAGADVDGIAFHWYSGDHFEAVRAARQLAGPGRELIFTEGCDSFTAGDPSQELPHAEHYAHELIGDFEAGANAVIDWNILLDSAGGPNHVGNFCDAPIMHDVVSGNTNVRLPFHYLGHFSRFIEPGARRILSTRYTTDLETCAFANPNGTYALVVLNRTPRAIEFNLVLAHGGHTLKIARANSPAHSIQTICW